MRMSGNPVAITTFGSCFKWLIEKEEQVRTLREHIFSSGFLLKRTGADITRAYAVCISVLYDS